MAEQLPDPSEGHAEDDKAVFSSTVKWWFTRLAQANMEPNHACALALKVSSGMTEPPISVPQVMASLVTAKEASQGSGGSGLHNRNDELIAMQDAASKVYRLFSNPDALHAAFWRPRAEGPKLCDGHASDPTSGSSPETGSFTPGGLLRGQQQQRKQPHTPLRASGGKAAAGEADTASMEDDDSSGASSSEGGSSHGGGGGNGISKTPPEAVDVPAIVALYAAIQGLGSMRVANALTSSSERLLQQVASLPAAANPGLLRQLLVLLLNPALEDVEQGRLLTSLCTCLVTLTEGQRGEFRALLADLPLQEMRRLVITMQQYITITLYQKQAITPGVEVATQVLGLLYDSNEVVVTRAAAAHVSGAGEDAAAQLGPRQPLPFTEFYNDAVNNEDFNLKEDFRRWRSVYRAEFSFCRHPFVYDPASKARVLQMECQLAQYSELHSALFRGLFGSTHGDLCPFLVLKVRRGDHMIQDTLVQVHHAREQGSLRKPLKVKFVGEEGVDEGGVQKEFFTLLVRELFNPAYGMFAYDETLRLHWFRPSHLDMDTEFELAGILFGLAIYNSHILECSFPLVLYKLLVGVPPSFADLKEPHPEVYASLSKLLAMPAQEVEALGLTFSVDVEFAFGQVETVELIPGEGSTPVSATNRAQYVELYTQHLLQKCVQRQLAAFQRGFLSMCGGDVLKWFRPEELELLVCGSRSLDLGALQAATLYDDGYSAESTEVQWFWQVALALPSEQQKRLLAFVTGSDRVPIKGLGALNPPFVISRMGGDPDRLPTAHTCFNHLLLPSYTNCEALRQRLLMALENAEGFGLM